MAKEFPALVELDLSCGDHFPAGPVVLERSGGLPDMNNAKRGSLPPGNFATARCEINVSGGDGGLHAAITGAVVVSPE